MKHSLTTPVKREHKGTSLLDSLDNYIVIDLETTGLSPQQNTIIEIGAVRVEGGEVVDVFDTLIDPEVKISSTITNITGITNNMLKGKPTLSYVLPQLLSYIDDNVIVAHNAHFDINFLYEGCLREASSVFANDFICTMRISRRLFRQHRHHRLSDLVERFGISDIVEHRALSDAAKTQKCYEYMKSYARDNDIKIPALA